MLLVYNKLGLKTAYLSNTLGFGEKNKNIKVMFGNSFYFLFSKTCFWEYNEKPIFLYFWNQKQIWLVEIKKIVFWRKK